MKVWLFVLTVLYPHSLDDKVTSDRMQSGDTVSDDCLDYRCVPGLPKIYKNKEECEKAGKRDVLGPAKASDGTVAAVRYKCLELTIDWIEQKTPTIGLVTA
jgi:hypothetical protein